MSEILKPSDSNNKPQGLVQKFVHSLTKHFHTEVTKAPTQSAGTSLPLGDLPSEEPNMEDHFSKTDTSKKAKSLANLRDPGEELGIAAPEQTYVPEDSLDAMRLQGRWDSNKMAQVGEALGEGNIVSDSEKVIPLHRDRARQNAAS